MTVFLPTSTLRKVRSHHQENLTTNSSGPKSSKPDQLAAIADIYQALIAVGSSTVDLINELASSYENRIARCTMLPVTEDDEEG